MFHYVSGLREESSELSVNEIFDFAVRAAVKCLNQKRMEMLRIISIQDEPMTITSMVEEISHLMGLPRSTVWINMNRLKELGLISNGRGKPVRVTAVGNVILHKERNGGER